MDETSDEMKLLDSVETAVHGTTDDDEDSAKPPYHHVDEVTARPQADGAATDEGLVPPGGDDQPPVEAPSSMSQEVDQRKQPRSTTKCRVVPIVVSGQSTARLGQLCYETAENSGQRP